MSTGIVPRQASTPAVEEPRDERLATLRRLYAPGASPSELEVLGEVANGLGLSLGMRQVYAIQRFDKRAGHAVLTVQIGIDGLRLIAQRSGAYESTDPPQWCGPDGVWRDLWLDDSPPAACQVGVWRKGAARPTIGRVMYREFKQESPFWRDMPANQLAIRAEAKALRMAFQADIQAAESAFDDAEIELRDISACAPEGLPPADVPQLPAPARQTRAPVPPPGPPSPAAARATPPSGALAGGAAAEAPAARRASPADGEGVLPKQLESIRAHLDRTGQGLAAVLEELGVPTLEALDRAQASDLLRELGKLPNAGYQPALAAPLATELDPERRDAAAPTDAAPVAL